MTGPDPISGQPPGMEDEVNRLAVVMAHYADMVYGTSRRVLGNESDAADVAQETFYQFLRHADQITGSIGAWLHQVATGRAIDLVRKNAARRRREAAYAAEAPHFPDTWGEVEPLVDEALAALPDDERELLVLHFLERQTMTQLAEAYDVSQPTISRRVAAALDCLRAQLRARGLVVGVVTLSTMLPGAGYAAPPAVIQALGKMSLAHAASAAASAASAATSGGAATFLAAAVSKKALLAGASLALALITWLVWRPPAAPRAARDAAPAGSPRIQAVAAGQESPVSGPVASSPPELAPPAPSAAPAMPVDPGPVAGAGLSGGPGPTTNGTTRWTVSAVSRFGGRLPLGAGGGSFSGVAGAYVTMSAPPTGASTVVAGQATASSFFAPWGFPTNPAALGASRPSSMDRAGAPVPGAPGARSIWFGGGAAAGMALTNGAFSATQSVSSLFDPTRATPPRALP